MDPPSVRSLSDAPDPLPAYVKLGRFQLVARLGKGGMGDVFLAVAGGIEGVKKLLVIKRLHDSFAEDENMRSLFLAEGRLAARLNHPNVVQTYEVGEDGNVLYLAMEYLEGQPLNQINKKIGTRPFDHVIASRIVSEALAGLHYAHDLADYDGKPLGLVHRDVSPQNIFVTYDGTTKVLDFGIAKVTDSFHKTRDGVLKGKVAYMAPEQVSGEVDRRSDVFSAGIVLWELLARRRLMAEATMAKTLYRVLHGPPIPRLSKVIPGIDPKLEAIVARALQRHANGRYKSAQEMRDALERYIAGTGTFVRQEDVSRLMSDLFKSRRERIAEQISSVMAASEETDSIQSLPAFKAATGVTTDSGQATPPSGVGVDQWEPASTSGVAPLPDSGVEARTVRPGKPNTPPEPSTYAGSSAGAPAPASEPSPGVAHTLAASPAVVTNAGRTKRSRSLVIAAAVVTAGALVAGAVILTLRVPAAELGPPTAGVAAVSEEPSRPEVTGASATSVAAPSAASPAGITSAGEPAQPASASSSSTPAHHAKRYVALRRFPVTGATKKSAPSEETAATATPSSPKTTTAQSAEAPAPAEPRKRKYRTDF